MEQSRLCDFAGQEIKISHNTKLAVRGACDKEKEAFRKTHWSWPKEVPCHDEMWESLCEILNTLEAKLFSNSNFKIRKRCVKALNITGDGQMQRCHFKFTHHEKPVIQVETTFCKEVEREDVWGDPIKDADGRILYDTFETTDVKTYKYPQDFYLLINALEQYLADEMETGMLTDMSNGVNRVLTIMTARQKWEKKKKKNKLRLLNFFDAHLPEIQLLRRYMSEVKAIEEGRSYKNFCSSEQRVLAVDGRTFFEFENACGFDIDEKYAELRLIREECMRAVQNEQTEMQRQLKEQRKRAEEHTRKLKNSENEGEKDVEYAIEWVKAHAKSTCGGYVVSIDNNCESNHRYNCILLCNPEFKTEKQEYDHILVCSAGVVLIETKDWEGTFEILPDGQWVKKTSTDSLGTPVPDSNIGFQVFRHEALMKSILPVDTPVYSLVCFPNKNTIIYGKENFGTAPILTVEKLCETLSELCAKKVYSDAHINHFASIIEGYKVNKMR